MLFIPESVAQALHLEEGTKPKTLPPTAPQPCYHTHAIQPVLLPSRGAVQPLGSKQAKTEPQHLLHLLSLLHDTTTRYSTFLTGDHEGGRHLLYHPGAIGNRHFFS